MFVVPVNAMVVVPVNALTGKNIMVTTKQVLAETTITTAVREVLSTSPPSPPVTVSLRHHGWEATRGAAFVPLARRRVTKRYPSRFLSPFDYQSLLFSLHAGPPLCFEQLQERRLVVQDPGLQTAGEHSSGRVQQQATLVGNAMVITILMVIVITTIVVITVVDTYVEATKFV
jgi:hypothetical protein